MHLKILNSEKNPSNIYIWYNHEYNFVNSIQYHCGICDYNIISVLLTKKLFFSVHQLSKTIQGTCNTYGGGFDYDQSWISVL